jgi:hypothetical protein
VQDQFAVVFGNDQVDAGSLEISVEKQLRVRDDDGIRRSVRGVRRNGLDMDLPTGMQARAVSRELGIKFAGVIQRTHRESKISINFQPE